MQQTTRRREIIRNPPALTAWRSTRKPSGETIALNDIGILYTAPTREYSRHWGEHTQELLISPRATMDFTRFAADQIISGDEMAAFLERRGVDVSPSLKNKLDAAEDAGGEILQHFGQFGRRELVEAITAAGYDSARINEHFADTGARAVTTLLFDASRARLK